MSDESGNAAGDQTAMPPVSAPAPGRPGAFWGGMAVTALVLVALDWLLGSLLWLPFFAGLIGFLVEGLIAGGIGFRLARSARPVPRGRLWSGILFLTAISTVGVLWFEYFHYSARIGRPPRFAAVRNQAMRGADGDAARRAASQAVGAEGVAAFDRFLMETYPPGGALGYARWATSSGEATLTVRGAEERIVAEHRGWIWPTRTAVGAMLLVLGLGLAFDALKSPTPVRNVLGPGEEYEEIE